MIDRIGRRELHVGELVVRAAPHNVEELAENGAILAGARELERLKLITGPLNTNTGISDVGYASM